MVGHVWCQPGLLATVEAATAPANRRKDRNNSSPPASKERVPPGLSGTTDLTPEPTTARITATGGMAGWQITLIALAAAVLAAAAAVLLDRAWTARRAASATST